MLKHLMRNLLLAKVGMGVAGTYIARRLKHKSLEAVEQSDFFRLLMRLKQHTKTHRSDGFYQVSYTLKKTLADGTQVEAVAQKNRPISKTSLDDSLEIAVQAQDEELWVKLTIQSESMITLDWLPDKVKTELLGKYIIARQGSDENIRKAFAYLESALEI